MNKKDLKRLRIVDMYVMSPKRFLIRLGIKGVTEKTKITIKDLHFILEHKLCHADMFDVKPDAIYRGDILLIGTTNEFYPYYNPMRPRIEQNNNDFKQQDIKQNHHNITQYHIKHIELSISGLYDLYQKTGDIKYINKVFDRVYKSKEEENTPTKQKIYCKHQRTHF